MPECVVGIAAHLIFGGTRRAGFRSPVANGEPPPPPNLSGIKDLRKHIE